MIAWRLDGCPTISIKGKTVIVAILELSGSLIAFPVERALPTVTATPVNPYAEAT
jgi:hypothetical protein